MFICNNNNTVMFSAIESFSAVQNYKGGDWGNLYVRTKTGKTISFLYKETEYKSGEDAKFKIQETLRTAILENKPISF